MKKRRFTRVDVSMAAAIRTDNLYTLCNIGNLSLEGLFVKTGTPIRASEPVNILIYGPNRKFSLHATVVHSGNAGTGLIIDRKKSDSLSEWRNVVESAFKATGALQVTSGAC